MKNIFKNISVLLLTSSFLISFTAAAADVYTPNRVRANVDIDLFDDNIGYAMQSSYLAGVRLTIETVQNYGFVPRNVCLPKSLTIGEMASAIRSTDPSVFPDTNDGGVVYVYTALFNAYPC